MTLNVTAEDRGQPGNSNWALVEVNVVDNSNDLPPRWEYEGSDDLDGIVLSLDENVPQNTLVGANFHATHSGGSSSIFYFLGRGRTEQENKDLTFRGLRDDDTEMFNIYTNTPALDYGKVPRYNPQAKSLGKSYAQFDYIVIGQILLLICRVPCCYST